MNKRLMKLLWSNTPVGLLFAVGLFLLASSASAERAIRPYDYPPYRGSTILWSDGAQLTDAAPVHTTVLATTGVTDLIVDVRADKGMNVVITPLPLADNQSWVGEASTPVTVEDGGGAVRGRYEQIGAPYALVTVTKTESGSTSYYACTVRGTGQ